MSGIVGSRLNTRGSGLVGSLGSDGQVFTSSGAGASAVFEAAGGGKILQVTSTQFAGTIATSSTSYVTANIDHAITTTALNSKIWVLYTFEQNMFQNSDQRMAMVLKSDDDSYSAELTDGGGRMRGDEGNGNTAFNTAMTYLHDPEVAASTSITYRIYVKLHSGANNIGLGDYGGNSVCTTMEVSA